MLETSKTGRDITYNSTEPHSFLSKYCGAGMYTVVHGIE